MIRVGRSMFLSKSPARFFWGYFVVVCILFFGVVQPFSTIAQEWEVPAEASSTTPPSEPAPSEPAPSPEPIPEPVITESPLPAETWDPAETSSPAVPEENSSSSWENSSPTTQENPPSSEENSSPDISVPVGSSDNPAEPSSDASTPSVTLIDTGDEIISIIEWDITVEAEQILTLFSNDDVFVEIEVIFSDLDSETDQEIQNEPTLADNTDEDPNVDLVDPSIVSDPAGPLPEPETELPPEDTAPVLESPEASQSTIALLESLLEPEQLSVRRYEKEIIIDELATHTCRADIFRADVQTESSSRARVTLFQNKKKSLPSFLEIGALPAGIDVVFKGNKDYNYTPGTRETVIEFEITRQVGAREWDFTIPIIYTLQDGLKTSSVICQINILND
jgi:hypothetical protein